MIKKFKDFTKENTSATGGLAVGDAGNVYSGGASGVQEFSRASVDNSGESGSYDKSETNDYINKKNKKVKKGKSNKKKISENATANASNSAGMGNVVSSQPSSYSGSTIGTNFSGHGGTVGSGDISVPYNPGGVDTYMNQKLRMKPSGKRRKKGGMPKLSSKKSKPIRSKVMNFKEYTQDSLNKVTKIKDFGIDRQFGNSYNERNYNRIATTGVGKYTGDKKLNREIEMEDVEKILKKVENRLSNFVKLKLKLGINSLVSDDIAIEVKNNKFNVIVGNHPTEYFGLTELGRMIDYVKGYIKSA